MSGHLENAARTVRERETGDSVEADATLRRVLQRTKARSQLRARLHLVAAPLLAALVASVAWGASSGRLSSLVSALTQKLERAPSPPPPRAAAPARAPNVDSAVTPPAPISSGAPSPTSAVVEAPAPRPMTSRRTPAEVVAKSTPAAPAEPVDSNSLYKLAHRAHFESRDYAAALSGWDRYLEAEPNGTFVPEARWNRAVALVRLGRKAEAERALAPFARGDYGPYRRDEARALMGVLNE